MGRRVDSSENVRHPDHNGGGGNQADLCGCAANPREIRRRRPVYFETQIVVKVEKEGEIEAEIEAEVQIEEGWEITRTVENSFGFLDHWPYSPVDRVAYSSLADSQAPSQLVPPEAAAETETCCGLWFLLSFF